MPSEGLTRTNRRTNARPALASACKRGSRVVPGARFELARVSPYAPQTYVSTNSTTRARIVWMLSLQCFTPPGAFVGAVAGVVAGAGAGLAGAAGPCGFTPPPGGRPPGGRLPP